MIKGPQHCAKVRACSIAALIKCIQMCGMNEHSGSRAEPFRQHSVIWLKVNAATCNLQGGICAQGACKPGTQRKGGWGFEGHFWQLGQLEAKLTKVFTSAFAGWGSVSHIALKSIQKLQDNTRSIKILADYTRFVPDIVVKCCKDVLICSMVQTGFPQFAQWEKVFHELSS